jgi:hypothetical protein
MLVYGSHLSDFTGVYLDLVRYKETMGPPSQERERERERWGGVHAAPKKDSTGEHGLPWKIKYLLLTLKPMEKANGETSPRERVHTYILVYSSKTLLLLFFFSKFFHFLKPILNVSCSVLMKDIRENYSLKMQV